MKKLRFVLLFATSLCAMFNPSPSSAQTGGKPTLAVIAVKSELPASKAANYSLADLLLQQFEKTDRYQLLDRYDMD